MKRLLPAYPLFVKDPYFSLWSRSDNPTETNVTFWTGEEKPIYGKITVDGKTFFFLGKPETGETLMPTDVALSAFKTVYFFENELFSLETEYFSPLPLRDKEILSLPACYLNYKFTAKKRIGSVRIELSMHEKNCYCDILSNPDIKKEVRGGVMKGDRLQYAWFGLRRQHPLSHSADTVSADWGYFYLGGEDCDYVVSDEKDGVKAGKYIVAANSRSEVETGEKCDGYFTIAFDDVCSIYYYGEVLRGYFFNGGKTIADALSFAEKNKAKIERVCEEENRIISDDALKEGGNDYLLIVCASLRQSIVAHKLVTDSMGRTLFLSKECASDGCIATVDVSYPSAPLYLAYAPELVEGMLTPIFDFARMPVWKYDYAPHDAGVYPYCLGQAYAIAYDGESKFDKDIYYEDYARTQEEILPFYYLYPPENDIYRFERQMPVEECGNMLILSYLAEKSGASVCGNNMDLLKKWADYLFEKGVVPANQLCTDDFAGHTDENVNLSIKATVAIACFAEICKLCGGNFDADKYRSVAEKFAAFITDRFKDMPNTPLSFANTPDTPTFSLKYNLAMDKLLGLNLFDEGFYKRETDFYTSVLNKYGVPLDSRETYTKSDWLLWTAIFDDEYKKKIIKSVADFLRETPDRHPFADWFYSDSGACRCFMNRSVAGGHFMPILFAKERKNG